jgi:putative ABC transport system ATP-binding protein
MAERDRVVFRGRSIGFVFQNFNLLPALTARENVAIPLLLARRPRRQALQKASEVLGSVGLGERTDALPRELSGGEQQRVAIARAVVHEPQLIVCDEPTSNLDHRTGHDMIAILRELAGKSDRSLIIVTHDTRIIEFADRVARMDDGRITDIGNAADAGKFL